MDFETLFKIIDAAGVEDPWVVTAKILREFKQGASTPKAVAPKKSLGRPKKPRPVEVGTPVIVEDHHNNNGFDPS